MSRYLILVAMVAIVVSCGGNSNVSSTNDTFVSDSSLEDAAVLDTLVPDTTDGSQSDMVMFDDMISDTTTDPCAEYEQYNDIKMYCDTGVLDGECTSEFVVNVNGTCSFTCKGEVANVGVPVKGLKITDSPFEIIYPADADPPDVFCTPTS